MKPLRSTLGTTLAAVLTGATALSLAACSSSKDEAAPASSAAPATSAAESAAPTTAAESSAAAASSEAAPSDAAASDAPATSAAADGAGEAASASEGGADYLAIIDNEPVQINNATATCTREDTGVHFNVSNYDDPSVPTLDVVLAADNSVLSVAYATGTDITVMNDPAKPDAFQVEARDGSYSIIGEGIGGDMITAVPFSLQFTCS